MEIVNSTATLVNPQFTQAVHNALFSLLEVAILGVASGLIWALKLWINNMKSGWKRAIAERLVKYAQQKFDQNGEKAKYVAAKIHEHFPRLGEEEVEHLLEEAVLNLKTERIVAVSQPKPSQ